MILRLFLASALVVFLFPPNHGSAQIQKAGIKAHVNIPYGEGIGQHVMDLYLPPGYESRPPLPVVLWVHGGGWEGGDKANPPALFLVGKGYAVASINYRLTALATFPAQIHDCKAAVRFLRANAKKYNFDPDRIGVWGSSAGGHLVALLGASTDDKDLEGKVGKKYLSTGSQVQAVCDWYGPTDLEQFVTFKAAAGKLPADYPNQIVTKLLGGSVLKKSELAKQANPITFLTAKSPPFLIMHGDRDTLVPLSQSQLLVDAIKAKGGQVEWRIVGGAGHDIRGSTNLTIVQSFFDKHLAPKMKETASQTPDNARLLATFAHQAGKAAPGQIKFYSNGYLGSPNGPHTWVVKGNVLIMYWYDDKAPRGMWIDTCVLSTNGASYRGKNQDGVAIAGERLKGAK